MDVAVTIDKINYTELDRILSKHADIIGCDQHLPSSELYLALKDFYNCLIVYLQKVVY